jgi:hypothetical protein
MDITYWAMMLSSNEVESETGEKEIQRGEDFVALGERLATGFLQQAARYGGDILVSAQANVLANAIVTVD